MHRFLPIGRGYFAMGLGAFVVVVSTVISYGAGRPLSPLDYVWVAAPAFVLLQRCRFPLTVFLVVAGLAWTFVDVHANGAAALYVILAMFTLATRRGPLVAGLAAAGVLLAGLITGLVTGVDVWLRGAVVGFAGWLVIAIAVATSIRFRRNSMAAEREQVEERGRRRAEEERLRIAREVHDVIAHSLAMINVQAGVAAHVADRRPEEARRALLAIKEASHVALDDLRATLAVLRSGQGRTPAATLRQLADLTDATTAAGLPVRVEGEPGELPAPIDSAAYRIVQESLTNAVRHADGATSVSVRFARTDAAVEVLVSDDGTGPGPTGVGPAGTETSQGNGLRGMRERAEALGGTLVAGTGSMGGFEVRAVLPMRVGEQ